MHALAKSVFGGALTDGTPYQGTLPTPAMSVRLQPLLRPAPSRSSCSSFPCCLSPFQGNLDQAQAHFRRALQSNPEHARSKKELKVGSVCAKRAALRHDVARSSNSCVSVSPSHQTACEKDAAGQGGGHGCAKVGQPSGSHDALHRGAWHTTSISAGAL